MGLRVLVCGGRDFNNAAMLARAMAALPSKPSVVIHGAARGADTLAGQWAKEAGVPVEVYPAEWAAHGRKAGALRNAEMLAKGKPDFVLAMPGGSGTAHMVSIARLAGVPTATNAAELAAALPQ